MKKFLILSLLWVGGLVAETVSITITISGPYGPTVGTILAHERCLMWYHELKDDTPILQACPVPEAVYILQRGGHYEILKQAAGERFMEQVRQLSQ